MTNKNIMNKETVKEMARSYGADLVGIASIDRFADREDEFQLLNLMPNLKSVIVLGFSINRGALRGVDEGTNWGAVNAGSPNQSMIIPSITYKFCKDFEKLFSYEAVCLTKLFAENTKSNEDKPTENKINFFEYAAFAAGLGEISRFKFFLTREYGTRQYFAVILTDAFLEADPILSASICDSCLQCATACPNGAIDFNNIITDKIAGIEIGWHRLCIEKCSVCKTGALSNQYLDDGDFNILNRGAKGINSSIEPTRIAAACGRACNAHLEDTVLKDKFFSKFRK